MTIQKKLAAKEAMRPKEGYNVVGVDSFEDPGEDLFLVAHTDTRAEAEKALEAHKKNNPDEVDGDKLHIYGPPNDP